MNNVRTVSDTKKTFYALHTRPVNTIYRRVTEEMMVEMHLLSVNVDFSYNSIYGLGVVTAFDRFMQGYQPETDKASIFNALCQSIETNPEQYQQDAHRLQEIAKSLPVKDLVAWLSQTQPLERDGQLQSELHTIANNPKFKYSRLFAIGLFSLIEAADPELVKDEKQRTDTFNAIAQGLHISDDKLNKDLELYRSNLDKMAQAMVVMADMVAADRKKREQRSQQQSQQISS
ncbi:photosystem II biogenesis protein Psp29 [Calothrix sp. UHCC 0171]|uniref:photosystem II biogenesis protein Psp29 n=1 Tax=Calothrix sp. UHCC 0171 TaxID=3110245 RepID=UPI002B22169C|nr:photosystem II biogenesis protein Psp29 [Calothrix sp. UHCC 0171]MEA5570977.1 photosystem II biogenesis protein Psp29 [Calothrix sp. UHCC 0171]